MSQPLPKETLLARGQCCGYRCRNCPYLPRHVRGSTLVKQEQSRG